MPRTIPIPRSTSEAPEAVDPAEANPLEIASSDGPGPAAVPKRILLLLAAVTFASGGLVVILLVAFTDALYVNGSDGTPGHLLITRGVTEWAGQTDRSEALVIGGFLVLLLGLVGGAATLLRRIAQRLDGYSARLLESRGRETQLLRDLEKREARFHTIFDEEPACVKIVGADGCLIEMNRAGLELIEADSIDTVRGRNVLDIVVPEYRDQYRADLAAACSGSRTQSELEIVGLKGTRRWMSQHAVGLRNEDGSPATEVLAVSRDITEAKLSEARVRWSEAQLKEAQRVARIGSWSFDLRNETVELSSTLLELLEVEHDEAGHRIDELKLRVHSEDRECTFETLRTSISENRPFSANCRILTPDGRVKYVHSRGETVYDVDGNALRTVGTTQDVTELKEAERELIAAREVAESANRSKSEFLANMSHEIRTPLTAILGYADLLQDDEHFEQAPEQRLTILKTIRRAGDHLLTIVDDILDLSRIEAGRLETERVETDLTEFLSGIEAIAQARAVARGLQLRVSLEGRTPSRVLVDPTRLRQILLNLISNAVKFTETGTVFLTGSVAHEPGSKTARLRFEVEDTGAGMTPEQVQSIFEPFVQGDTSLTRRYGGAGLGLSISRRLAAVMGGDLSLVRSEPGQGSCFRLVLEAELAEVPPVPTALERTERRKRKNAAPVARLEARVLLAEDSNVIQRLVSLLLEKAGAEVDLAENGLDALSKLSAAAGTDRTYDLLVTDMQMPEMDGYGLAQELRSQGSTLPIVALTAHAMAGDRQKCIEAGCNEYATKPIDREQFLEACRRAIGKVRAA